MSIYRRIEALEEQLSSRQPEASSWARARMKEHLDRIAHARHTGWDEEIEAEVQAVGHRLEWLRGEGHR